MHKPLLSLVLACCALPGLAQAEDQYFDSNGVKIRYVVEGEGIPVVLIHGWMSDSSMWGQDAEGNTKLGGQDGFQLIAFDVRGHGRSGKPQDPESYGEAMAADVTRLLDHLKIKKAHLLGYSMGAFIAGKFAATHPDRVLSVVYGGQAPLISSGEWTDANEVTVFAKAADEGKKMGAYIMAVSPPDKRPTAQQADAIADFMLAGKDVKALAAAGRSFRHLQVSAEDLAKCKAPALFIYGSEEGKSVKSAIAEARKVVTGNQVKVIEGANHITALAKPDFATTILEFLRALKGL